jgi:hypothetical protein
MKMCFIQLGSASAGSPVSCTGTLVNAPPRELTSFILGLVIAGELPTFCGRSECKEYYLLPTALSRRQFAGDFKRLHRCRRGLAIEGTKHTVSLGRIEPALLDAMRRSSVVRKLKPMWTTWTGPTDSRLEIRRSQYAWLIEGTLFIGGGKRSCHIYVDRSTRLSDLRSELEQALSRFEIPVIERKEDEMHDNESAFENRQLTVGERWAQCLIIYECVRGFKRLEEDEGLIDLQLEELMSQKEKLRAEQEKLRADALQAEALRLADLQLINSATEALAQG